MLPSGGETEAGEDFVEDQHDVSLGTDLAQSPQPCAVGGVVELAFAGTINQRRIGWRIGVWMKSLQGIHQNAGDIAPRLQEWSVRSDMSARV